MTEGEGTILRTWRDECPQLNDLWRTTDMKKWEGVEWSSSGKVIGIRLVARGLTGPIPRLLEGLKSLTVIDLGFNNISGEIPVDLFRGMTSLRSVWLNNNNISGTIPENLFRGLNALQYVSFHGNNLTGSVPVKLFDDLQSLKKVWLNHNKITGKVTDRFLGVVAIDKTSHLRDNEVGVMLTL